MSKYFHELKVAIAIIEARSYELNQATSNQTLSLSINRNRIRKIDLNSIKELVEYIEKVLVSDFKKITPPARIYIPVLRTSSSLFINQEGHFERIESNIFRDSIAKNYKISDAEGATKIEIITGLSFYEHIRKSRNSRKETRKFFEEFERFLSVNFFNGIDVDVVARSPDPEEEEHITIYLGGDEHDIHNFGDGIQALIIIMYTIYTAQNDSWLFIEEPELNLHPAYQRLLITQIIHSTVIKEKGLSIFFTTHSNHLLNVSVEATSDLSVFTFEKSEGEKNPMFQIRKSYNSDYNILKFLGVNPSSVFLANSSIWVEGISDRKILKGFLKAYEEAFPERRVFVEDLHYAFFEYSGSNILHYKFDDSKNEDKIRALFLNNQIFLLSDKDSGKELKHKIFQEQQSDRFRYKVLSEREIENILSPEQVRSFLRSILPLSMERIIAELEIKKTDYSDKYLGDYLVELIGAEKLPRGIKAKSGSLATYYKNKLSSMILDSCTWDEMSRSAQNLVTLLYDFLQKANE